MPIRFPAPGLFSTKNCWPSAREKWLGEHAGDDVGARRRAAKER
jgi:hypothetical protein